MNMDIVFTTLFLVILAFALTVTYVALMCWINPIQVFPRTIRVFFSFENSFIFLLIFLVLLSSVTVTADIVLALMPLAMVRKKIDEFNSNGDNKELLIELAKEEAKFLNTVLGEEHKERLREFDVKDMHGYDYRRCFYGILYGLEVFRCVENYELANVRDFKRKLTGEYFSLLPPDEHCHTILEHVLCRRSVQKDLIQELKDIITG